MEIRLGWVNPFRPLEELPEGIKQEVYGYTDISGDEVVDHKRREGIEAVEEKDQGEKDQGDPAEVGLEGRLEDERIAVDALRFECFVELDVGDRDTDPGEEVGNCHEVLEPGEGFRRSTGAAAEVGEEGDGGSDEHTPIRNTTTRRVSSMRMGGNDSI